MVAELILLAGLVSALLAVWRGWFRHLEPEEGWFLAATTTLLTLSLVSLALVRANRFQIRFTGMALVGLAALAMLTRRPAVRRPSARPTRWRWALPLVLLGFLALYALFPTYYLLGGRDQGVYIIFSVLIGKTGGINVQLPQFGELYHQLGSSVFPWFPGLYDAYAEGYVSEPGPVIPQFRHLLPALAANGYGLAGLEGVVRVNAVLGVMSLWSFYLLVKALAGRLPALLATLVLGANPVMIWHCRVLLTEVLAQWLLLAGLYLIARAWRRRSPSWGLAGGALLGGGFLNRVDAPLTVMVVLGVALMARLQDAPPEGRRVAWATLAGYLIGLLAGTVEGYLFCFHYLKSVWIFGLRPLLWGNVAVLVCSVALLLAPRRLRVDLLCRWGMSLGGAALWVWMLYAYFILPHIDRSEFELARAVSDLVLNDHAVRELGWWVNPLVYALFLIGFWGILRTRRWDLWLPLGMLGGAAVFLFTWRPNITDQYIFATRRWLPHVIPMLLLYAVAGLQLVHRWLADRRPRAALPVVALSVCAVLASSLYIARPFLFTSIMKGYVASYARLAAYLDKHPMDRPNLTFEGHLVGPLTYLYGHPTFWLTEEGFRKAATDPRFAGYRYIGLDDFYPLPARDTHQAGLSGMDLDQTKRVLPRKLYHRYFSLSTGILTPGQPRKELLPLDMPPTHGRFHTTVGVRDFEKERLVSTGKKGIFLFGPYLELPPGRYEVTWRGKLEQGGGRADVVHNGGNSTVSYLEKLSTGPVLGRLEFELKFPARGVEFRVFLDRNTRAVLTGVSLRRIR